MTVNHPQFGTMCAICFTGLTPEQCAQDTDGQKWDVQQEPRFPGGETPPETDDTNAASGKDGKVKANSEVIDEGPTDDASQK